MSYYNYLALNLLADGGEQLAQTLQLLLLELVDQVVHAEHHDLGREHLQFVQLAWNKQQSLG